MLESRNELEERSWKLLQVDPETTIGIYLIDNYSITTRDGDMVVILDVLDDWLGASRDVLYHRCVNGLMVAYNHKKILAFLEVLRRHMILDDLVNL